MANVGRIGKVFLSTTARCACPIRRSNLFLKSPRYSLSMMGMNCSIGIAHLPEVHSVKAAKIMVLQMDDRSRRLLNEELNKVLEHTKQQGEIEPASMSYSQLRGVFLFHGVPFIGFGLLDNIIMILAGEYIDSTFGAVLGISTMAAAGLGNMVSDVAGVGSAGYVETLAERIGVKVPEITPEQARHWKTRWAVALGRAIGVSLGCLMGMFPLLFFERNGKDDDTTEQNQEQSKTTTEKTNPEPQSQSTPGQKNS